MESHHDLLDFEPFSSEFFENEESTSSVNPFEMSNCPDVFEDSSLESKITEKHAIMPSIRAIMWFRRDLRLHDNHALHRALKFVESQNDTETVQLIPLYIIHRPKRLLCGVNRFQFLLESVGTLAEAIAARGSRLIIARGEGIDVFRRILPAWKITHIFFDQAIEPFAIARDHQVRELAASLNVHVETTHGYTLYDQDKVIEKNGGKAPATYTAFLRTVATFPEPPKPLPVPLRVSGWDDCREGLYECLVEFAQKGQDCLDEENQTTKTLSSFSQSWIDVIAGPEKLFRVPELSEFGFEKPGRHSFIYGGENIALKILQTYCKNEGQVVKFEKPKTSPAETCPSKSTTSLSPYLYFGCMSTRTFYHRVRDIQNRHAKASSAPPVSLDGQLLWREFFHCNGHANPQFDKMEGNPLCLYIDWRWHTLPSTKEEEDALPEDEKLAKAQFEAWKEGQTGYPWIDAIMIQLKEEGWMHHLARHSVACFLTRGDLYISWVRGLEVFQERLIDHDWSINCGNWLWLSASAFFTAYFRVYSPSTFGKKWDAEGKFIRKYIPALAKMPSKYIYEPWKAPVTVQRLANCLVGKDYPFPIVDHKIAMRRCMAGMKASYAARRYSEQSHEVNAPPHPKKRSRDTDEIQDEKI
uniref:Cryptochrome putative n=1 Tax=Albugo laibachii Nc14 TaxID=890382 RepID=F0W1D4_9STRA|nr:cryptochrome putative [Albugo laibachii Nc14]|eukprot:CCA14862.1 cryptochrome putative [Albugo laibachii Nc14]